MLGEAAAPLSQIVGAQSLLMFDEDKHRRSRGMMSPAFHGDSVRRQVAEMVAITAEEVARWPVGEQFPGSPAAAAHSRGHPANRDRGA